MVSANRTLWVYPRGSHPGNIPKGAIAVSDDPWMMHVVVNRLMSRGFGTQFLITLTGCQQSILTLFVGHLISENLPFFTVELVDSEVDEMPYELPLVSEAEPLALQRA